MQINDYIGTLSNIFIQSNFKFALIGRQQLLKYYNN